MEVHSFYSMVWIRQIINCRDMKSLFSWRYGPGLIRAHTVEWWGEKGAQLQVRVCWCRVNNVHYLSAQFVTSYAMKLLSTTLSFTCVHVYCLADVWLTISNECGNGLKDSDIRPTVVNTVYSPKNDIWNVQHVWYKPATSNFQHITFMKDFFTKSWDIFKACHKQDFLMFSISNLNILCVSLRPNKALPCKTFRDNLMNIFTMHNRTESLNIYNLKYWHFNILNFNEGADVCIEIVKILQKNIWVWAVYFIHWYIYYVFFRSYILYV